MMRDAGDSDMTTQTRRGPVPAAMDPAFRADALRGVRRLRQALQTGQEDGEFWRDGALALFQSLRASAAARDYAMIAQLAALGGVATRYDGRASETARALCSHVAKALSIALETGVTTTPPPSARAVIARLTEMTEAQAPARPVAEPPRS